MTPILLVSLISLLTQAQPSAISSPTTDSVGVFFSPNASSQPTAARSNAVTEPGQVPPAQNEESFGIRTPQITVPWEFLIGFQHWGKSGNVGIGFSKGIHEIRLLGPNTGLYLDYKASLLQIKGNRLNVGGMIGIPSVVGGHVGVQYRTGGDSFWGRVAVGIDGGVSCSRVEGASECSPAGGVNIGLFFAPSDFTF